MSEKQSKIITTFSQIKTKRKEKIINRNIINFFNISGCVASITFTVIFQAWIWAGS